MSAKKKTAPEREETPKTAQVRIIKHRLIIGNHMHSAGVIIDGVPFADAKFKEERGDLEILNVQD